MERIEDDGGGGGGEGAAGGLQHRSSGMGTGLQSGGAVLGGGGGDGPVSLRTGKAAYDGGKSAGEKSIRKSCCGVGAHEAESKSKACSTTLLTFKELNLLLQLNATFRVEVWLHQHVFCTDFSV